MTHQAEYRTYSIQTCLTVLTVALILVIVAALTFFAAWSASRIQKETFTWDLEQTVKQGAVALHNYLEAQLANLDLWTSQPIVDIFFNSPELAAMSVPGLRGFFDRVRAWDAGIATVLFISGGKIVFDDAGLITEIKEPKVRDRVSAFIQDPGPAGLALVFQTPGGVQRKLVLIKRPYVKNRVSPPGAYGVVAIDLVKIQETLFANLGVGRNGFAALLADTGTQVWAPGLTRSGIEKEHFIEGCRGWRTWSDVPSVYRSMLIKVRLLGGYPLAVAAAASRRDILREIRFIILICVLAGGVAIITGFGGAMVISKWLSHPLTMLVENIRQLEWDRLSNPTVRKADIRVAEVSILHEAYGAMIEKLIAAKNEIQQKKSELESMGQSLRQQRNLLQATLSSIGDGVITTDTGMKITFVNPVAERLLKRKAASVLSKPIEEVFTVIHEITRKTADNPVDQVLRSGTIQDLAKDTLLVAGNGNEIPIDDSGAPILDHEGNLSGAVLVFRDVTEQRNEENKLKESEERFRILFEINPAALLLCDFTGARRELERHSELRPGGMAAFLDAHPEVAKQCAAAIRTLAVNSSALSLFKARDLEQLNENFRISLTCDASDASGVFRELLAGLWEEETPIIRDTAIKTLKGDLRSVTLTCVVIPERETALLRILICINDITERQDLEMRLRQAQKLESVGRLAGGVAHDYNNMLSVILGYAELAMMKIGPQDAIRADLMEIMTAAQRSTDITRQLLAFARKQTIAPKVIDLNKAVESMLSMLRRLIGENLDLAWHPRQGLSPVKMDPSQIDQILANLCVNSRDAISGTGKITIETDMRTFDQDYCRMHNGFIPGDFVMLAVSDDGCGMDKQTQERIFEPFFTTKKVGQGTGLGLSTIFGIVKQNKGFINVYSEPGKGTTFRLFFSSYKGAKVKDVIRQVDSIPTGRGEQLLLVEDEASTLKMIHRMLTSLGYKVLATQSTIEAVRMVRTHAGDCALLITDVVMPEMNGRDLAKQIAKFCPGIRTLFMSGYTADVIAHHGILHEGVHFIQKPFSKEELAVKVRTALGDKRVAPLADNRMQKV